MGKFVAKRKLRNSYSQKNSYKESDKINGLYSKNITRTKTKLNNTAKKQKVSQDKFKSELKNYEQKILNRFLIQTISVIAIFIFIFSVKKLDIKIIKNSKVVDSIKQEFNKNYTAKDIKISVSSGLNNIYSVISPIIPESFSQKTVAVFSNVLDNIKNYGNSELKIYSEVEIYQEKTNSLEGVVLDVMSTSVIEENDVSKILNSGVVFVNPTVGVITSNYGEREEIFKGNGTFHNGVDIANSKGTKIVSSISGNVTVCGQNSGYGKYVEVENGDILTRYCHLDKIDVKEGDTINCGDKIGEMGMTGQATGYHLHFEILYEGKRVDPQKILTLG